jgi:hypothetical protein
MSVICQACVPTNSVPIKSVAFSCLVRIAELYYEKLQPYMQGLYGVTHPRTPL